MKITLKTTSLIGYCVSFFLILLMAVWFLTLSHRIHGVRVLLFPWKAAPSLQLEERFENPEGKWTVKEVDKQKITRLLNKKVREAKVLIPSYRLQLVAYEKKGGRFIYFSGFCFFYYHQTSSYWQTELVGINDGGKCFFDGEYNIEKSEIESFHFGD